MVSLERMGYSEATQARITIVDSKGKEVLRKEVGATEFADNNDLVKLDTTSDFTALNGASQLLSSNKTYTVKLESYVGGVWKNSGISQTWKTLKKAPKFIGKPSGYPNSQTYFDLIAKVQDDDEAITGYTWKIRDAEAGGTLIETLTSTKNTGVSLYLGPTKDGKNVIEKGHQYVVEVVANYFDNEKNVELTSEPSDGFLMTSKGEVSMYFTWNKGHEVDMNTTLNGILTIDPKEYGKIFTSEAYPLSVMIESSGNYKSEMKFNLYAEDSNYTDSEGKYNIPILQRGLKEKSSYRISAWGWVQNPVTLEFAKTYLGDCVVSTGEHSPIYVNVVPDSSVNVGVTVYFGKENDTENTANLSTKSVKMVRAAIYTGSSTSGEPVKDPVEVYVDSTDNSNPYTGDFVKKYWGANGRASGLHISAQTLGLSSAELTASKYTIAILGVYDYTYNYDYNADSAQKLTDYENQLPFETGSISYYSVSYDEKIPDFPSPLTSGVTATPITNAKADLYLTGTTDKNLADDTIVGYNLHANYNNTGGLANSVTYYVMTEKDILGYNADTDIEKGNDPTEWEYWGKDKGTNTDDSPRLKFTLPVNANDKSLPSINIFFMQPINGMTSTMDNVKNSWSLRMSDAEIEANRTGGAAMYFNNPSTGTVSIFVPGNSLVTRGWHYVFAYKARLTFRSNSNYIFPNDVTGSFSKGILLSSEVIDTPKQSPDVKMYIEKIEENGVQWKYKYSDVDGSAPLGLNEITDTTTLQSVFMGAKGTTPNTNDLEHIEKSPGDDFNIMKMRISGASLKYSIRMNQNLYQDEDVLEDGNKPTSALLPITTEMFMPPMEPDEVKEKLNITLSHPKDSNTVRFEFKVKENAFDLNRISYITITGTSSDGKQTPVSFAGFTGTTDAGNKYVGYDLSLLGAETGETVTFKVDFKYDSGLGGQYYLSHPLSADSNDEGNTGDYIVEARGNDEANQYMNYHYALNANGNPVLAAPTAASSAYYGRCEIKNVTNDKAMWPEGAKEEEGDLFLQFRSRINNFPASYTDAQREELMKKQVLQLRLKTAGYKGVIENVAPLLKVEKKVSYVNDSDGRPLSTTVGILNPTISDVWRTAALTTCNFSFRTNSKNLLADEKITVEIYEENEEGEHLKDTKVIPLDSDSAKRYEVLFENLAQSTDYKIYVKGTPKGTDNLTVLLDNDRNAPAIYEIHTMDGMEITGIKTSEFEYNSYTDKKVRVSYGLSLTEGFNITYRLMKIVNGVEQETHVTNDQIMEAMGYHRGADGKWLNKDDQPWSYMSEMTETINISKNTLMQPGNTYRLYIEAKDNQGHSVTGNTQYFATIVWDKLIDPGFYVESKPINNGNGLEISVTPQDPNKVFAEGDYVIVLYNSNDEPVDESTCVWKKNVADGIQTVKATGLSPNENYKLRIYARKDLENKGTENGLTYEELEKWSFDQRENFGAYKSTEKTMDTWGGRFDSIQLKTTSGNQIQILVYNGYNLDKIKMVQMTVNWVDSKNAAHTESRTVSAGTTGLFTQKGTTSTYTTTIPIELTDEDAQYAITVQFLDESGGQIYKDTITYTP